MKIKKVTIKNFRSIKSIAVNFLDYMVFVGKNNSGKSNILKALDNFFNYNAELDDFRKEDDTRIPKFTVQVEFTDLTDTEKVIHEGHILNEGTDNERLVVRFVAELTGANNIDKEYQFSGVSLKQDTQQLRNHYAGLFEENIYRSKNKIQNHEHIPEKFKEMAHEFLENKESSNRFKKTEFKRLRQQYISELIDQYPNLAKYKYAELGIHKRNPDKDLGTYFFIPAIQDIEKETQYSGRGDRSLNHLIDYILDEMTDIEEEKESAERIEGILRDYYKIDDEDSEMKELEGILNEELQIFDNSRIQFNTELPNLGKIIRDSLKVYVNDGIMTEVQYKGHGLQRYLMMVLFKVWSQKLLEKKSGGSSSGSSGSAKSVSTSTYFAIEEPELFLHPQYQRIIRTYLQNIASYDRHQIILNTHSPNFIEFENLYQLAKVYKRTLEEGTKVIQPLEFDDDGQIVENQFVKTWGRSEQQRIYWKRINKVNMNYYFNPNRNEIFFADKVVLVEGQTEKMLFQAWANYFFPEDFAILQRVTYVDCLGKRNLEQYVKILGEFEIPMVVIIDKDPDNPNSQQNNPYIRRGTLRADGTYFEIDPDFEGEFNIVEAEYDSDGNKKHKPYYAYKQFFEIDGTPKEDRLESIRGHDKLQAIFKAIYDLDLG
ncbi:MAG: AAA family ATPase [Promethearchaeia archaeon]